MTPLVTTSWLAARLDDPNLVLLDATLPPVGAVPVVDTRALYDEKHLPGAVFFDIEALSDHTSGLPHTLPSAAAFAVSMADLGVGDAMDMVVYEQTGVFSAPRAWWMLCTMGAQKVHILDGGLQAWEAAGLPLERGVVHRPGASFDAKLDAAAVKDLAAMQQEISQHGQILDARSAGRFSGAAPEPRAGLRSGHMPGAVSVPFTELVEDGRMKSAEALRRVFAAKGVDMDRAVTTTCGSGVTAAVISLGLEIAGARRTSLYDGSWAEYAQQPGAAIETGDGA